MSLGLTQPLIEMSTRNISWEVKADSLTDCLEIWEQPQPLKNLSACKGIAFALLGYISVTKYESGSNLFNRNGSDEIMITIKR
jgi:hypothetical protein